MDSVSLRCYLSASGGSALLRSGAPPQRVGPPACAPEVAVARSDLPSCAAQGLLVHAAAMSLEQLGITQLPEDTYLSFKLLNSQLNPPGRAGLFALRTTQLSIEEMIAGEGGIFGAVAYHADAEDIRGVDSRVSHEA